MKFSNVLIHLEHGEKAQRANWNGKGMFVFLIRLNEWEFVTDISGVNDLDVLPFLCMKTADNKLVPWLASQTDLIADDWELVAEVNHD